MIILQLRGGLGNQMFQYAYAYILAKENKDTIYLSTFYQKREAINRGVSINKLSIDKYKYVNKHIDKFLSYCLKLKLIIVEKLCCDDAGLHGEMNFLRTAKWGTYVTRDIYKYLGYPVSRTRIKEVDGFFQSIKYLKGYEQDIKKIMAVPDRNFLNADNLRIEKEILSTNSVCLHIRRGDYTSDRWKDALLICDYEYYRKAIEVVKEKVRNPVFYIFSNSHEDIDWIKREYKLNRFCKLVYVDNSNSDIEDLRLMYDCKHFILSNSSFSWWAQFMSNNDKKLVIAPNRWTNENQDYTDIYEKSWIVLSVQ